MGIVRGLNALNQQMESSNSSGDGVKGRWLQLKDGQSMKIRFLQEVDPDSEFYIEKAGLAFIAVEHSNPDHYQRKALCTIDDQGRCFGCEQHRLNPKAKWGGKKRFYANVLVAEEGEDPYVAILSQGLGSKSATEEVIAYAGEVGSITNTNWKLKRSGTAMETSYSIIPTPTKDMQPLDIDKYELFDLEKTAVREVAYEDQEEFYLGITSVNSEEPASASSSAVEW